MHLTKTSLILAPASWNRRFCRSLNVDICSPSVHTFTDVQPCLFHYLLTDYLIQLKKALQVFKKCCFVPFWTYWMPQESDLILVDLWDEFCAGSKIPPAVWETGSCSTARSGGREVNLKLKAVSYQSEWFVTLRPSDWSHTLITRSLRLCPGTRSPTYNNVTLLKSRNFKFQIQFQKTPLPP